MACGVARHGHRYAFVQQLAIPVQRGPTAQLRALPCCANVCLRIPGAWKCDLTWKSPLCRYHVKALEMRPSRVRSALNPMPDVFERQRRRSFDMRRHREHCVKLEAESRASRPPGNVGRSRSRQEPGDGPARSPSELCEEPTLLTPPFQTSDLRTASQQTSVVLRQPVCGASLRPPPGPRSLGTPQAQVLGQF